MSAENRKLSLLRVFNARLREFALEIYNGGIAQKSSWWKELDDICEGRSINKLQNSVILLVFLILKKIRNLHFVGNLMLSTSCDFYYDDVTVTSFIKIKYGDVAVEVVP